MSAIWETVVPVEAPTSSKPSTDDVIVEGSVTYHIVEFRDSWGQKSLVAYVQIP